MTDYPIVSVIIPCRDEKAFIQACLDSIIANDYPKDAMELLVVDGKSNDGTETVIEHYKDKYPFVRLLENPEQSIPAAMNVGIKNAKGEIVMKMDAHTTYAPDYISKSVSALEEHQADNCGGVLITVSENKGMTGDCIVLSLSHPFAVGNSHFRTGSKEPRWVDTVSFGCYRKQKLLELGMYNEKVVRGSDMELNLRLKRAGGKILLMPDIKASYYAPGRAAHLMKKRFVDGAWAIFPLLYTNVMPVSPRHLVPLFFVASLLTTGLLSFLRQEMKFPFYFILAVYFSVSFYFSFKIALTKRKALFLILMPFYFFLTHASYGLGSLLAFFQMPFLLLSKSGGSSKKVNA